MKKQITEKNTCKKSSQLKMIVKRFGKNRLSIIGMVIILILVAAIALAPLYCSYDKVIQQSLSQRFLSPSAEHFFGTDQYGRDLFARIVYGGRISLFCGLVTIGIAFVAGMVLGCAAGFFGGMTDTIIMRFCDVLMAIPGLLLAMAIVSALGQGIGNMLIALSISQIPREARTARSCVMTLRNQEYIEAAKTCGTSRFRIIWRHIVPNILGPMIIDVMMGLGSTILRIASLGFLGIGIASPTPEWGTIISENQINIRYYPYLGIIPGLFIMITVLSFNFIGDGLRDALDPKMKN
ncbi:MAG: ABC transporter permease [Acetatifactor sp.]|nr:ABC transporter permease [Acetatifactor sp.]MDE7353969.1 ABC transporter permease [Acetatifactor sp.]